MSTFLVIYYYDGAVLYCIGGTGGFAIIIYNDGTGTTISNVGGTITGTIQYNTAPS